MAANIDKWKRPDILSVLPKATNRSRPPATKEPEGRPVNGGPQRLTGKSTKRGG